MRVLQVMAGSPNGGAEGFFERLTVSLHRRGLDQKAIIRRDASRARRLADGGVTTVELPFGGVFDFVTTMKLRTEIRQWAPDVILVWMNRAAQKTPRSKAVLCARLGGYYNLKYYRHCDHLIGNTEDIVSYIRRSGWPEERSHYLPNFVDAKRGEALDRRSFGTPDGVPIVLAYGRLHRNKAFDVLIDAMSFVPEAHLWLAGDGPERAALEALVKERDLASRCHFLGWREDTAALLAASDVFVCPSRHEPLGNVVLEAFAHGKPVVAAASQGPSALIADGVSGRLVPIDDATRMGAAISELLRDQAMRQTFASNAHKTYSTKFAEDVVTAAYLDFFARVRR